MALAVPTDALDEAPPAELERISKAADDAFDAGRSREWKGASAATAAITAAWERYPKAGKVPPRLQPPVNAAIEALSKTVRARDQGAAQTAAIDVAQAALDIELRYRPPDEIDLARFELWARQTVVDTAAKRLGAVSGDVASLEWTRDRFADRLNPADLSQINAELLALREAEVDKDLAAVREAAARVSATAASLELLH
jgi:hypothetical protein